MTTISASGARPPLRSHLLEMGVGLAGGLVALAVAALAPSEEDARIMLAALLAGIGFVYLGFAVADGRRSAIIVQAISALVFLQVAQLGFTQESTLLLGIGYLAHGGWDLLHHEGRGPTQVRTWYPPFCVVADVVIGLPLVLGLVAS